MQQSALEADTTSSKQRKPRLVDYAPLKVPGERRLQTLAVILMSTGYFTSSALFLYLCSFTVLWPILIAYLIWIHVLDRAPNNGGRPSKYMRNSYLGKYFVGYFPATLVKTAELPSDRTYVFGYHPHGIIGMGALSNFAFDATGFSTQFPGIRPHLLTLTTNFSLPFYRELLMSLGVCSVAYKSCRNILRQGPGSAITIVVGGATESLSARPGTAELTLKRRLGFIRLALREGADLVPVFSFGENDLYEQLGNGKGSKLRQLQKSFQNTFGFTLREFHFYLTKFENWQPFFTVVESLIIDTVGMMPFRRPIYAVGESYYLEIHNFLTKQAVGRPIHVEQSSNPSTELLLEYQKKYIYELTKIWDDHKDIYAPNRKSDLSIVE